MIMLRSRLALSLLAALLATGCGRQAPVHQASAPKDEVNPQGTDQSLTVTVTARARALPDDPALRPSIVTWCLTGPTCPSGARPLFEIETAIVLDVGRWARAPLAATSTYAEHLTYRSQGGGTVTDLVLAGPGTVANAPVVLATDIRRIDVQPMRITRPDGTAYAAQGLARISQVRTDGSEVLLGTIHTGTGLDVPAGVKYRVLVTVYGEDGPKTYTSLVNFAG